MVILIGGFGRSGSCIEGRVVVVRGESRVDLIEDHDSGVLDCRDRDGIVQGSDKWTLRRRNSRNLNEP